MYEDETDMRHMNNQCERVSECLVDVFHDEDETDMRDMKNQCERVSECLH